jgi:hypothetical protein
MYRDMHVKWIDMVLIRKIFARPGLHRILVLVTLNHTASCSISSFDSDFQSMLA